MITLKNVVKEFQNGKKRCRAVDNVNLQIKQGEIFGIVGYSGAGKSSLLRMINGLELPTSGSVQVGQFAVSEIHGKKLRQARQSIGMVFQHFNLLWSRTVFENISLPLEITKMSRKNRQFRVNELIRLVGLVGKEDAFLAELSGGQKQRVGIARALASNPQVLLCDEATSALDPQTTSEVLDLLIDINQKLQLTILIITHEMQVVRKICHRVAIMEEGKLVESGNVLEVFQHPKQSLTKKFLEMSTDANETGALVPLLADRYGDQGVVIKMLFANQKATEPIISEVIREQNVSVNVLHGSLTQTRSGSYGTLYVQMNGEEDKIMASIHRFHQFGVETEVISK